MTLIIGIDPGVSGAWAAMTEDCSMVNDMPTLAAKRGKTALDVDGQMLGDVLRKYRGYASAAYVEQVQSRPRQAGQFAFGMNYGRVLGVLEALGIPIVHVPASKWKPAMGLRGQDKATSVALAAQLFPHLKDQLYGPRGAPLDGRAEALLIAYYGSKQCN
ncbi:hypothetical protein [Ensifer adhaerens]|uniref:hypothetical protein n=1 Tax=Ensifer adhaerens TaxID=106592 RepID=UPI000CF03468|nr:hypothetical protein [Ensifer adhaerens]